MSKLEGDCKELTAVKEAGEDEISRLNKILNTLE